MAASQDDLMSPDASPGALSRRSGVRRVNNWPMYIIGATALGFLIIMALVASDRANQQNKTVENDKDKGGNSSVFAQQIQGMDQDGIVPSKLTPLDMPVLAVAPAKAG